MFPGLCVEVVIEDIPGVHMQLTVESLEGFWWSVNCFQDCGGNNNNNNNMLFSWEPSSLLHVSECNETLLRSVCV